MRAKDAGGGLIRNASRNEGGDVAQRMPFTVTRFVGVSNNFCLQAAAVLRKKILTKKISKTARMHTG